MLYGLYGYTLKSLLPPLQVQQVLALQKVCCVEKASQKVCYVEIDLSSKQTLGDQNFASDSVLEGHGRKQKDQ